MDSKKFETELKQQPDTVNMDYVDDVINASLSNVTRNYPGLLNAIITMEECGELIQEVTLNENGKDNYYDLLQEMADVEICIYCLMKIFNISKEEFKNQPESKDQPSHVTIAITKVCSKMIQEVSKAIRNKNNHYELLQSMVDTHHAIHQYMNAHNISEKALNKAINVKLNRLKKRGNNF